MIDSQIEKGNEKNLARASFKATSRLEPRDLNPEFCRLNLSQITDWFSDKIFLFKIQILFLLKTSGLNTDFYFENRLHIPV